MFIITIYKDSRKVKINRNYVFKCNLYLYFLIQQNLLIAGEKILMSAELKRCVTGFIYFLDVLWLRYNYVKFHHCRICMTDFREGAFLQPRKSPSCFKPLAKSLFSTQSNIWDCVFLAKIVNSLKPLSIFTKKSPLQMLDVVLNTPLSATTKWCSKVKT